MTSETTSQGAADMWKQPVWLWLSLVIVIPLIGYTYYFGIDRLLHNWLTKDEYSHGIFIPVLSLFLIWQKRDVLARVPTQVSWRGVWLTVLGIFVYFLGEISAITAITQFSLVLVLAGLALSVTGWQYFKHIWIAFLFLVFTIPLPQVIYQDISQLSQLVSSRLGVLIIRLFDISVYLEGNVIDLGSMKLQVVEACSGLRYLFPLMSLAFISAYFYRDVLWKRAIIFISSIPIAVLLNSLRIGLIGVTVEFWGKEAAEGLLHDFEGWVMFMACMSVIIAEMWVLTKLGKQKRSLAEVFSIEIPDATDISGMARTRHIPPTYGISVSLMMVAAVVAYFIESRVEAVPERQSLAGFPAQIGEWKGNPSALDSVIRERLDFDDYLVSNYSDSSGNFINFYIAYYGEQRKGASIHSPRACLPGGGWEIASMGDHVIEGVVSNGQTLRVNRTMIRKDEVTQLVYYWFKQRHRNETNEFMIKWWLFWDALTMNRTDGALIRLVTIIQRREAEAEGDERLEEFTRLISPYLHEYIPE